MGVAANIGSKVAASGSFAASGRFRLFHSEGRRVFSGLCVGAGLSETQAHRQDSSERHLGILFSINKHLFAVRKFS